jgi:hypothetical protein
MPVKKRKQGRQVMLTKTKSKITSGVTIITPDMATKWLEGNTHNRPINQGKVEAYARDMRANAWDLNGEAIIFDWNGVLQDGQHRLFGCIEAATNFQSMVVHGVDPATFKTIDTGKARTAKDVLGISGHHNLTTLAAAAGNVIRILRGDPRSGYPIPNSEVLSFVETNPGIVEWVNKIRRGRSQEAYSSITAAVLFLGSKTYPQEAEQFAHQFKHGDNLAIGSPVLAVRNRLFADKKLNKTERMGLIVLAWNAFVEGRTLMKSQLPTGDAFPTIKGQK